MKRSITGLVAVALASSMTVTMGTVAHAQATEATVRDVLDAVAPEVLVDSVASAVGSASVPIQLPETTIDPVVLDSQEGEREAITVHLPFTDLQHEAIEEDGLVSYDNGNGSTTVPVAKNDGSLQVTTVIEAATAPIEYVYKFSAQDNLQVELLDGGLVVLRDATGEPAGYVAPPWARDSDGQAVDTYYEVRGTELVQIVEHNVEGIAYPVVADPYLGQSLFRSAGGTTNISLSKSSFGHAIHVAPGGQAIFLREGWAEAVSRKNVLRTKATYKNQYDCHAIGGLFNFAGPTWDLEGYRTARSDWAAGVVQHRCNW